MIDNYQTVFMLPTFGMSETEILKGKMFLALKSSATDGSHSSNSICQTMKRKKKGKTHTSFISQMINKQWILGSFISLSFALTFLFV